MMMNREVISEHEDYEGRNEGGEGVLESCE